MKSCCPRMISLVFALLAGSAIFATGSYWGSRIRSEDGQWMRNTLPAAWGKDASSSGKLITVATGWIDSGIEGIYVLDHLTGNLQCWVVNSRSGEIGGVFRGNILDALGLQGKSDLDYVMATGKFDFSNFRQGNLKYSQSICYVGESSSGKIIGYSFTYDPSLGARGQPQIGELTPICTIPFRDESIIRN